MQGSFFRFYARENHRHYLPHWERVRLFHAHTPACFGLINPDSADPPTVRDC